MIIKSKQAVAAEIFTTGWCNLNCNYCYIEKNDYLKVTHDMQDIQILTRDKKITTFVLSQLSRNKEDIRKPRLSDLRDSGAIEEKSNIVLLVYWEDRLKQQVMPRKGIEPPEKMEIIIAKNRDGTIGTIYLDYYPEFCKLTDKEY